MDRTINVMIGGEAGQGLVTVGDLLVKGLVRSGYRFLVTQDYQSRIRGGLNTFVIRVGVDEVLAPRESVDLLLALNQETIERHFDRMTAGGLMVVDEAWPNVPKGALAIPYRTLAEGRYTNIVALGVAGACLGLEQAILATALEQAFGKKNPEVAAKNAEALAKAYVWSRDRLPKSFGLAPVVSPEKRLVMQGNEAIALGAMAAGVKFCAFYPMTPSTSIALTLAAQAGKLGLVVEQAEDEIAAINMAIGASFAGAPSMVTTSGGGFALMVEGVSLAAMIETPIVVAVIQRPGPATGLPTRTEQADLEYVLHAGHGEFPRAIFAPSDPEECFHLTRRAFDLAQRYQGPVFILSDQYLSDSYRAVLPFDLEAGPTVNPAADHRTELTRGLSWPYLRYALTESGVSPRLLPGLSEHLVIADSDEHTEDGHLTEDLDVRILMNEKRIRKIEGIKNEVIAPTVWGDPRPEILLVCWGTSRGAVLETAMDLQIEGRRLGILHFSQAWPLIPEQFLDRLTAAERVVAIEGNAFGQLARLIRRESGFEIKESVRRYDGLPLTPEYIKRRLAL